MPRSILVVDDDTYLAVVLSSVLDEEGYVARCAFDGREAERLLRAYPPDLLITDVVLPDVHGLILARRFRQRHPAAQVILMSATYADVDVSSVRFVAKPFDLEELLRLVRRALGEVPPSGRGRRGVRPSPVPPRAGAGSG
jgi:DNA-binding response OmpR family regulator